MAVSSVAAVMALCVICLVTLAVAIVGALLRIVFGSDRRLQTVT